MSINRYNPVHEDAMVADEEGTHVRYADHVQALVDLAESLGEQHEAALAAERKKWTTPNMFWEEDCDGDNAVEDPADIADRLNVGAVFCLMCAHSLPDAYFVAGEDVNGCSTATPASDEQIAEYKAAKKAEWDRRRAEWARRNAVGAEAAKEKNEQEGGR